MRVQIKFKCHKTKQEFETHLAAAQIPYSEVSQSGGYILVFNETDRERVMQEWNYFQQEKQLQKQKPGPRSSKEDYQYSYLSVLFVIAALLYFHFMANKSGFETWVNAGAAHSVKIIAGELFRTVTALCLHSNLKHLLGNAVGLLIFAPFLTKETGSGWGWLLALAGGATGNYANALFHSHFYAGVHLSIGASTLLFAIVGLLGSKRVRSGLKSSQKFREAFLIPFLALFGLLAIMGVSGQNTDIFAHLFGMLCGVALGVLLGRFDQYQKNKIFQGISWAVFAAIIATAWIFAL